VKAVIFYFLKSLWNKSIVSTNYFYGATAPPPPGGKSPLHCWGFTLTHLVGLLWNSDQPIAETSTWQHTTLIRDTHATAEFERATQHASGCRPTPYWPAALGLAVWANCVILNLNRQYKQSRLFSDLNRWLYNYWMQFTVKDRSNVEIQYFRSAVFSAVCGMCMYYAVCVCT